MQIAGFMGGLACGHISDWRGSGRIMIVLWWSLGAGSVFTLAFLNNHLINLFFVTAAGFFIIGGQFVLNNFTANVYETRIRATAVGMELSVGRVGAILGPWVTGLLQQHYSGSICHVPGDYSRRSHCGLGDDSGSSRESIRGDLRRRAAREGRRLRRTSSNPS